MMFGMAIHMKVTGLRAAGKRLGRSTRFMIDDFPHIMTREMAREFSRVLRLGSKRPGRPRQSRFVPYQGRSIGKSGTIDIGWYGRDYRDVPRYIQEAIDACVRRGFRQGFGKARRRFLSYRL